MSDWRPTADLKTLRRRARLLEDMRAFFRARDVLEVETPCLSAFGVTDLQLTNFETRGPHGKSFYLHTSPEYPMKRLLAAGSGDIWQCCRVFRRGEAGRRHNPEFTLLEWYRLGLDMAGLMAEVSALIAAVGGPSGEPIFYSYQQAFETCAGVDPLSATTEQLKARATELGLHAEGLERNEWLDLLFSEAVCARFLAGRVTLVHSFPADQAALARLTPGNPVTAERFEAFIGSVELANGYHELIDADEQATRFGMDNQRRKEQGKPAMESDLRLLAALTHGLPDCSGVALGVDRLLMAILGENNLSQVIAFPVERA